MGSGFSGGRGGTLADVNVVPLIDILLVLLVIFMIIPHKQLGLPASLPQEAKEPVPAVHPETIIVQVVSDGSIRLNGVVVEREELRSRLGQVFALRAERVAFFAGRSFSRVSVGCRSSERHACRRRFPDRSGDFGTGKKPLNVME